MTCVIRLPWPCHEPTAGGSKPLGAILCVKHLIAQLTPLRDPLSQQQRQALRRYHPADKNGHTGAYRTKAPIEPLDPEAVDAVVALSAVGATFVATVPLRKQRDSLNVMTERRTVTPDDTPIPAACKTTQKRAAAAGWRTQVSGVEGNVMLQATREGAYIVICWERGRFTTAWHIHDKELTKLGYRAAAAQLGA